MVLEITVQRLMPLCSVPKDIFFAVQACVWGGRVEEGSGAAHTGVLHAPGAEYQLMPAAIMGRQVDYSEIMAETTVKQA
jgi:hypothetical protein